MTINTRSSNRDSSDIMSSRSPAGIARPDWLDPDRYPFSIRTADLAAGPVAYVDEGEGPTLLFVHAGMWSFIFRDVITRLRSDFRCITLDFPGYGLSPEPDRPLSLRDIGRTLRAFIDHLDLDRFTLVLHDLGGPVGLAAVEDRPERVEAMALANTFLWTPDGRAVRTMFRVVGSRPMTLLGTATNLVPRLTSGRGGVGRHLDDGDRRLFRTPYDRPAARRLFHTTMRSAFDDPDLTDGARRLATGPLADRPVLTIFGEKNDPFGFQDRHASIFENHRGVVVADGNHFPMMDDPDLFAKTLRRWYEEEVDR